MGIKAFNFTSSPVTPVYKITRGIMVEGPGCKLKGIKIKAKLKGQSVHAVKGNAVDKVFNLMGGHSLHKLDQRLFNFTL